MGRWLLALALCAAALLLLCPPHPRATGKSFALSSASTIDSGSSYRGDSLSS